MFRTRVLETFENLYTRLEALGFDVDLEGVTLSFPFAQKGTYLFKMNSALEEIWVSSPLSGGQRFAFDDVTHSWRNIRKDETLDDFLTRDLDCFVG